MYRAGTNFDGRSDNKHTRDRDGAFGPQVVRKREKILADFIGLYAIGNSTREISNII